MPHLVLEYSTNIVEQPDFERLFSRMHWILTETGAFKLADIKSRAVPCPTFYLADGNANNAFVHVRLEILEGRSHDVKKQAGERLLTLLKETFALSVEQRSCALSVELRDMQRDAYFKN
ncbi:MAG: 5-carboxymethyl-2-hydroxymuconate Delta-isomerase [Candidatus Kapaibacterium sp.]|nr:MAG: 5-carboxymethyl-2-hydroxymuconate Delta-isomerase [Candidatus Kapabacteria bacterium]